MMEAERGKEKKVDKLQLDERLVVLHADVTSPQEALCLAGTLFERYGYADGEYGQAMIRREERYPTGLAGRRFGIAIPHADGEWVRKNAAAVIIPEKPVPFGRMGERGKIAKCGIILPFAVKNSGLQLSVLRSLMRLFTDEDRLEQILMSENRQTVIGLLREAKL